MAHRRGHIFDPVPSFWGVMVVTLLQEYILVQLTCLQFGFGRWYNFKSFLDTKILPEECSLFLKYGGALSILAVGCISYTWNNICAKFFTHHIWCIVFWQWEMCLKFQLQLQSLMETLNSTEPHYIRCVKPNNVLKPAIFENANIIQQLHCGVSMMRL